MTTAANPFKCKNLVQKPKQNLMHGKQNKQKNQVISNDLQNNQILNYTCKPKETDQMHRDENIP